MVRRCGRCTLPTAGFVLCAPLELIRGGPRRRSRSRAPPRARIDVRDEVAVPPSGALAANSSPSRELPGGIGLRHGRRS
jgi:hypothetical protein